ncbi:MAG: hypothetical protein IPH49_05875 [Ignavibacteria bacterium]|nr:hypothetical protein [Ignavibacteria bacterium]
MKIRSIGIDTITFVIASRPGFIDAKSANGRFISQLAASALHYRVSTNEDGVQRRPAYGQTAISGSYRGLYVVSNEQMTTVTCSVPSLIGGNNINGFPINRMNEFVEEVSSRIEEDVSVGRITRLDLCVNVDSSAMLVDFMDQYYSTDRRYKESLYERSTKYIGCKSKQNALYSQVNRIPKSRIRAAT